MQAYEQTLTCTEADWQLLRACYRGYYKNGQTQDHHNNKYYCPASRLKFYEDIIDVISKAQLWAKDNKWKPKIQPSAASPPPQKNISVPPPPDRPITVEEMRTYFQELLNPNH